MANEHKNSELQQSSDGYSPINNTGTCNIMLSDANTYDKTVCVTTAVAETVGITTATTPDLRLCIETTNSNNNSSNSCSATKITQSTQPGIVFGTMRKSATTTAASTQNASTFSFKHFLSSSSSTFTAPSTTVTSLDPVCSLAASTTTSTASTMVTASNGGIGTNARNCGNTQKPTGARPKVPQSTSLANDALCGSRGAIGGGVIDSGLTTSGNSDSTGGGAFGIGSTRMKRSPRFSSFDSQASLAEYVAAGQPTTGNSNRPNRLSLHPTLQYASNGPMAPQHGSQKHEDGNADNSGQSCTQRTTTTCAGLDLQIDNMGIQHSPSTNSLPHINSFRGVSRRSNQNLSANATNKLDLPINNAAAHTVGPTDFTSTSASAAALPDFVQDHWMDSLYMHDMHLISPRNSPTRDFGNTTVTGAVNITWSDLGAMASGNNNINAVDIGGGIVGNNNCSGIGCDASSADNGSVKTSGAANTSGASKMLPDFLSDGPIIHSSQRLADVAAGLPSNTVGSPEDPPITSQLSNLRLENERLQRELSELRTALCEQTRRANDLERKMEEENRRRTVTPTSQQMLRLKQQLAEVTEEAEILRRENDTLREEGAVGGLTETGLGQRSDGGSVRPMSSTRSQQISQALLRAASNAENNLRQLLAGVDNLRQMASDIEGPGLRLDYDGNSDIYSDFLDDCDGFEDFSGGPAL